VAESPLDGEISLEDLIATYRVLVHSGASIAQINAIRKHLSAVKGGRLARAAYPAQQVSVMVSDVPESALDSLASGPTMPDSTTEADCYRIAEKYNMTAQFPPVVRELFEKKHLEETPKSGDAAFVRARWWPILSSAAAERAAAEAASRAGFAVEIDHSCDDWEYTKAADYLLSRLRELRKGVSRACLISGGEVTVAVPPNAGVGGRNQQFALYCAEKIVGEDVCVLSAGTDGIDGNSLAAGAVVDGTTVARAGEGPVSARKRFDGFPLFERLGDAVVTGPTGNNVRDLRVLVAY
jgi:hydroxypyruvate reductase